MAFENNPQIKNLLTPETYNRVVGQSENIEKKTVSDEPFLRLIKSEGAVMNKVKILIVEDEAIIAMNLESDLTRLGYEVTSIVDSGEKAIEKAESDHPDIILMDIRLKGKMDGIETAARIQSRFKIPAIFSTAHLDQKKVAQSGQDMPFGYLQKPFQEKELQTKIEMALMNI